MCVISLGGGFLGNPRLKKRRKINSMKQVRCSPKSAILPSVIGNMDNPLLIGSSDGTTFFLFGMAVARLKKTKQVQYQLKLRNIHSTIQILHVCSYMNGGQCQRKTTVGGVQDIEEWRMQFVQVK